MGTDDGNNVSERLRGKVNLPHFVTNLRCLRCGRRAEYELAAYLCENCGAAAGDPGILDVEYDYDAVRHAFGKPRREAERADLFRWLPLLPVDGPASVLPAGDTPLVSAPRLAMAFGLRALWLKDETRNPTRALKDRATAIGVARALESGSRAVYCASAGNAAISLAGFAAHAGLDCHVFVPSRASDERLRWLRSFGAHIHVSKGDYDQAFDESEVAGRSEGWYSRNCAFNPFLVEGKKTAAFEVATQLGGTAPDFVVAPVGDGCTLSALGKGFREMRELGEVSNLPRLVGVQAEGVSPLVRRFHNASPAPPGDTDAASIAVRRPRNALRLLAELEASDGTMIAVPDDAIARAERRLATEAGMVAEFTSAATLAGLERLAEQDTLKGATVVLVITGGRAG